MHNFLSYLNTVLTLPEDTLTTEYARHVFIASLTSECSDDILVCGDAICPGPDDSSVHVELREGLDSVSLTQLVTQLYSPASCRCRQPAGHPIC